MGLSDLTGLGELEVSTVLHRTTLLDTTFFGEKRGRFGKNVYLCGVKQKRDVVRSSFLSNKQPEPMASSQQTGISLQQLRSYAAWYGMWLGICWSASFLLTMAGLTNPMAGNIAFLVGIASLPFAVWMLRNFGRFVVPLSLPRAWLMAWLMFAAAALITTAVQYIYFAYFDEGRLLQAYTDILSQPEQHDLLQQMLPGQDIDAMMDEIIALYSSLSLSQLTMQFLIWNLLLATLMAFPAGLLSFTRHKNDESSPQL